MKVLYTAEALATGDGRDGHVRSSDGIVDMEVAIPPELGGNGGATNPEQLFAAGYAACFHSALRRVARGRNASVEGSTVGAKVGLGMAEAGAFGITVELDIHLPALDEALARELTEAAHKVCPYSNATRGNVEVTLSIV